MRKSIVFFGLIAGLFAGEGSALTDGGSHVSGGGDIRRFRTFLARREILTIPEELVATQTDMKVRALCGIFDGREESRLLMNAELINRLASPSYIEWQDRSTGPCLSVPNIHKPHLFFSYGTCLPAPSDSYLDLIFSTLQKIEPGEKEGYDREGQAALRANPIPTATFLAAREYLRKCQKLRNLPFGVPNSPAVDPKLLLQTRTALPLLEKGRKIAIQLVEKLTPEILQRMRPYGAQGFFYEQRAELLEEIRQSPLTVDSPHPHCGHTDLKSQAPIRFAPAHCQHLLTELDIAWMIVHEATHHFGSDSESLADSIATTLLLYGQL